MKERIEGTTKNRCESFPRPMAPEHAVPSSGPAARYRAQATSGNEFGDRPAMVDDRSGATVKIFDHDF